MVAVQLRDDVVVPVSLLVVEVGEVAFLAPGPARPLLLVVFGDAVAAGYLDSVLCAPRQHLGARIFIAEPYVIGMWKALPEHGLEGLARDFPRFRGRLRHYERRPKRGDR